MSGKINIEKSFSEPREVFVYGTLMRGHGNNHLLKETNGYSYNLARLNGYALYEVASFPGIVAEEGEAVKGELYHIDDQILKALDQLEGEGSLYIRKKVMVETDNGDREVYTYVWNNSVLGKRKLCFSEQPWGKEKLKENGENLIWYACYGSNTNEKYFLHRYLFECSDKTYLKKQTQVMIPHELYFANHSSRWQDEGVAFIDPEYNKEAQTLGRAYLITENQFKEIRQMEGPSWYDRVIDLEEIEDYPAKTFTHSIRWEFNAPSMEYLNVISDGLWSTYVENEMSLSKQNKQFESLTIKDIKRYLMERIGIKTDKDVWLDYRKRQFELVNINGRIVELDENIVDEIVLLNGKGYITTFCCGGHITEGEEGMYVAFIKNYNFKILPNGFYEHKNNIEHTKRKKKTEIEYDVALANFKEWVKELPINITI